MLMEAHSPWCTSTMFSVSKPGFVREPVSVCVGECINWAEINVMLVWNVIYFWGVLGRGGAEQREIDLNIQRCRVCPCSVHSLGHTHTHVLKNQGHRTKPTKTQYFPWIIQSSYSKGTFLPRTIDLIWECLLLCCGCNQSSKGYISEEGEQGRIFPWWREEQGPILGCRSLTFPDHVEWKCRRKEEEIQPRVHEKLFVTGFGCGP